MASINAKPKNKSEVLKVEPLVSALRPSLYSELTFAQDQKDAKWQTLVKYTKGNDSSQKR